MVRSADRAAAQAISVIDNARNVVLDAGVDLHRHGNSALADQLLEIMPEDVIVSFVATDFENRLKHKWTIRLMPRIKLDLGLFFHLTRSCLIDVRVPLAFGQAVLGSVFESVNSFSTHAAEVGQSAAVD